MDQASPGTNPSNVLKDCAGCGTSVPRQDCHRNRYGEYICRTCQAAGIRFSPKRRRFHWLHRLIRIGRPWFAYVAIAIAVTVAIYMIIDRVASAPPAAAAE